MFLMLLVFHVFLVAILILVPFGSILVAAAVRCHGVPVYTITLIGCVRPLALFKPIWVR